MATPGVDVWPVTLGARDAKCRVRFAVGDALSLDSPRSARDTDVPTGGDGENSAARSGFGPDPELPKPPGSFFSGLTLVDDRAWVPVRILRGWDPAAAPPASGYPRVSPGLASATRKTPDRRRRRASCCAWSAVVIPAIVARPAARATGDRARDRVRDRDRDLDRVRGDRFSRRGRRR